MRGLELKAEFMGGTAPRVKSAVQEAMGGCLFLDEAYALMDSAAGVGGAGDAFSQEALRSYSPVKLWHFLRDWLF